MANKVEKVSESTKHYVYDISLDGSVVDAYSMLMCHNTDGFNFRKPDEFWFTEDKPYVASGYGRNTEKGKEYTECEGDVAWFEDHFLPFDQPLKYGGEVGQKMGLGIDEYCDSCTQVKRKNYIDLMPDGKLKLVGNSIKSKKIPAYIEDFLNEGLPLYARGKGKEFLDLYYDYVEKIYNMQIPLKKIASLGKIKTSIAAYKESCNTLTKSGSKKARQAWYELAIKHNLDVHMGDTIYYINVGTEKGSSDVKRVTKYFYVNEQGEKVDYFMAQGRTKKTKLLGGVKKDLYTYAKKEYSKLSSLEKSYNNLKDYTQKYIVPNYHLEEEDVLFFNCVLIPQEAIENEDSNYVLDDITYNRAKYIDAFNKKVAPLLVSFRRDIREKINDAGKKENNILITHPKDRKYFTEDECEMISGEPLDPKDQDTYEEIMTMDGKEIKFWLSQNDVPIFASELGMDWEKIKSDYLHQQELLLQEGVKEEKELYDKIISSLSMNEMKKFMEDGVLPKELEKFVTFDNGLFISQKYEIELGNIYDIVDQYEFGDDEDEEE